MAFKTFYPYKFAKEANSWLGLPSLVRMYRLKRKKNITRKQRDDRKAQRKKPVTTQAWRPTLKACIPQKIG